MMYLKLKNKYSACLLFYHIKEFNKSVKELYIDLCLTLNMINVVFARFKKKKKKHCSPAAQDGLDCTAECFGLE